MKETAAPTLGSRIVKGPGAPEAAAPSQGARTSATVALPSFVLEFDVSSVLRMLVVLLLAAASPSFAQVALLNVSYDVARDFYKDFNPMFQKHWKAKTGEDVVVKQSHGGSTKQVRAVADGLEADVVTMNQATDVDFLAEKGLVAKDWPKKFPGNASPYTSTMVLIVRKG